MVEKFKRSIAANGLEEKVVSIAGDLCEIDYNNFTIIVIYLLPDAIELIKPKLQEALMKEGSVLICNTWGPKGWTPVQKTTCGFCKNVTLIKYDKSSFPII